MIMCDELLNRLIVAEVSQVTEDRHEPLRLERVAVNIDLHGQIGLVYDALVLYLIGEETSDDGEEARCEVMMPDNV